MKNNEIKQPIPAEVTDDALEQVSGGIRDAQVNPENEYIKEETMLIIPMI